MQPTLSSRLLGTFIVHVLVGAALAGFLWWYGADANQLIFDALLEKIGEDPANVERQRQALAGALRAAGLIAVGISWLCSVAWLMICEGRLPAGNVGAAAQRGSWITMLAVALIASAAALWFQLWETAIVATRLAPGIAMNTAVVSLVAVALGYYLATARFVRRSMRVSVPGAAGLFKS